MATKRISELPAKGAAIGATDLVEISEPDGLGGYVSKRVTGAQLGTDTNLANTNLTQTAATDRLYDMNGNMLRFDNGRIVVGNDSGTPYIMEVNGTGESSRALFAQSSGLIAVHGEDSTNVALYGETTSGIAVLGEASTGSAGTFRGNTYVETSGVGGSQDASSVFEANSTTKGALLPRMTTTERNAISSPATGLEIYNTTTGRKEVYNGTFWRGISMRLMPIFHGQFNPTDAQTVAFGQSINAPTLSTNAYYEIIMRGAGVIRGCDLNMQVGGTLGSNENWSLYVRHNGTDYLVQTISSTTVVRNFSNASLNIPYVDGDIVRMIYVNPTWATNPTAVTATGNLILL